MTELIDNIKAIATGTRKIVNAPSIIFGPLMRIEYTPANHKDRFDSEYAITVTLGAKEWIEDEIIQLTGGRIVDQAIDRMKHSIAELVYGKIRRDLFELRKELRKEVDYYSPAVALVDKIIEEISL